MGGVVDKCLATEDQHVKMAKNRDLEADPATVFERPDLFGTVRRGAHEGETEILIL